MTRKACEPQLSDVLNDPIVQILMNRDAVVESSLLDVIDDARRRLFDGKVPQTQEEVAA